MTEEVPDAMPSMSRSDDRRFLHRYGGSCDPLWLRAWRCVNCGEVTEPGIVMNRTAHRNWLRRTVNDRTARIFAVTSGCR